MNLKSPYVCECNVFGNLLIRNVMGTNNNEMGYKNMTFRG